MANDSLSKFFQRWVSRANRRRSASPELVARAKARLGVEQFEDRLVPASIPAASVLSSSVLEALNPTRLDNNGNPTNVPEGGSFQPQAVVNPLDPNNIVVVSAGPIVNDFVRGANTNGISAQVTFDGGQTWTTFLDRRSIYPIAPGSNTFIQDPAMLVDPTTSANLPLNLRAYTNVSEPTAAFARDGSVYLSYIEHNAAKTSGALVVEAFQVDTTTKTVTQRDLDPNRVIRPGPFPQTTPDRWIQADGANNQVYVVGRWINGDDPYLNPFVAVDNNIPTYTDPQTGQTQTTDTNTGKAVYVAWNTNAARRPANFPYSPYGANTAYNPDIIMVAASQDGGVDFSTPAVVTDGSYFNFSRFGAADPEIVFSPAELNPNTTVTPGQMTIVSSRINDNGTARVVTDRTAPDGGIAGQAAVSAQVFSDESGAGGDIDATGGFIPDAIKPQSGPDIPGVLDVTIPVNITDPGFTSLSKLTVTLAMQHPHLTHVSVYLQGPDGRQIQLVNNRIQANGQAKPKLGNPQHDQGLADLANMGYQNGIDADTTFDMEAPRYINDDNNPAPFVGTFIPETGFGLDLTAYNGATAAQLNGLWHLIITDYQNDGNTPPVQFLSSWSINFTSRLQTSQFNGNDRVVATGVNNPAAVSTVLGAADQTYPLTRAVSPTFGIGPGISAAYDTSLGSYSPYSGRLYMTYVAASGNPGSALTPDGQATNTNVFLIHSDDNGVTWSSPVQVNDDNPNDEFTQGMREQFQPAVTVDPMTGTVVVMWYDARYDASDARIATYVATSIDGGNTFSSHFSGPGSTYNKDAVDNQTWLNPTKTAVDAVTGQTVTLEPVPSNLAQGGGPYGFGIRQSIIAFGGTLHAFWAGNDNSNATNPNADPALVARSPAVYHATAVIAAGPRVVSGDMGSVTNPAVVTDSTGAVKTITDSNGRSFTTYNDRFAADGSRLIDGFIVRFDRPVDASTFTPADVTVLYRGPSTDRSVPASQVPVAEVIPIDPTRPAAGAPYANLPPNATSFFVRFATPQSALGTYSYAVGPHIRDRVRPVNGIPDTPSAGPTTYTSNVPFAIPDNLAIGVRSPIVVPPPAAPADPTDVVYYATVTVNINHTSDRDLRISLIAPDGTEVVLSNRNPANGSGAANVNYTNTTFDDAAATPITAGSGPFTGTFRPQEGLAKIKGKSVAGTWQLKVVDQSAGGIGSIQSWSLTLTPGQALGNYMDQDADSVPDEAQNDRFTAPGSTGPRSANGVPFALPFQTGTLPLLATGPHVVSTSLNGLPASSDNVAVNTTVSSIDVTFDRDMDPASFTREDVIRVVGPTGVLYDRATAATAVAKATVFNGQVTGIAIDTVNGIPQPGNGYLGTPAVTITGGGGTGATATALVANGRVVGFTITNPGTGYTSAPTVTIQAPIELLTVTPVANANGTVRTFRVGFPPQSLPGQYSLEFASAVQSAARSELVTVLPAGSNSVSVTFDSPQTLTPSDVSQVIGPNGAVPVAGVTQTGPATWRIDFASPQPAGQYVVTFTPVAGDPTRQFRVAGTNTAVDNNFNAGLDVLRGGNPTTGTIIRNTYSTTGAGATIVPAADPDPEHPSTDDPYHLVSITDLPLDVGDDFTIQQTLAQKIAVLLNIQYPDDTQLEVRLVSPSGDEIRLFGGNLLTNTPPVGQRANFTNTRLSDSTTNISILQAAPPFNPGLGSFVPQQPLSALIGTPSKGTWLLRVRNHGTDTGLIQNWSLTLPQAVAGTGLGEDVADRFTASFRVFTQDPTNPQSRQVWTPVGPVQVDGQSVAGRVTAVAIDPSDPSGNTVYVGGASGGIWKTSNFMTQDGNGPTWQPLTDLGPTTGLNVGGLALFPRNNDPNQTIVFALTGEGDSLSPGIGVLRSQDGGRTWEVLDSANNLDPNNPGVLSKISDPARGHQFAGLTGYKIVVDPKLNPSGRPIVYMALSDPNGPTANPNPNPNAGVWRSNDGGNTWTQILQGNATDITLAPGSGDPVTGNLNRAYAALQGVRGGVYGTSNAPGTASLTLLAGGLGNGSIVDALTQQPIPVRAPAGTPTGAGGRIVLATPALTNNVLADAIYQEWVYALAVNQAGTLAGLYLSKDFGRNWTQIPIPSFMPLLPTLGVASGLGYGSNNEAANQQQNGVTTTDPFRKIEASTPGYGNVAISIAIDPTNPNVVYLGGLGAGNDAALPIGGLVRVDATIVNTPYTFVSHDNSAGGVGAQTQAASAGGVVGDGALFVPPINPNAPGAQTYPTDFINLFRDPNNPFAVGSTLNVSGVTAFTNNGQNAVQRPFIDFLRDAAGNPLSTGVHRLISVTDPITGTVRLVAGTDEGVYTGVDIGNGTLSTAVGFSTTASRSRNGNLQIGQYYSGAVQPSQFAADVAGAMFYAMSRDNGFPVTPSNVLSTGNITGTTQVYDPLPIDPARVISGVPEYRPGSGTQVVVDETGSGLSYQYRQPAALGNSDNTNLFFRRFDPGVSPAGGGLGRTSGLLRGIDVPINDQGQWPIRNDQIGYFAVNPLDPRFVVIGSDQGRIYGTRTSGDRWDVIGEPGQGGLPVFPNGTFFRSLAFGSRNPNQPSELLNFVYAGTTDGRVFVTTTGGGTLAGSWLNISAGLDNSPVMQIVTDPRPGRRDAFAVTQRGVYYKADATDTATPWENISGNLFNITRTVFGDSTNTVTALTSLTSIAADWRYTIPIDPQDPSSTRPNLYVAGEGGVFKLRSWDPTQTVATQKYQWSFFPDAADEGSPVANAAVDGGLLPNTTVTDLDLSLGNINPTSGLPEGSGGLDMLLATTFGRGQFAIRLDPTLPASSFVSGPRVTQVINPTNPPTGPTGQLKIRFSGPVDPVTFTASDVQLLDPNGVPVSISSVALDPSAAGTRDLYVVNFAQQSAAGLYKLTVGYNPSTNVPLISDFAGNLMNQDADGTNGEPVQDQYVSSIFLNGTAQDRIDVTGIGPTTTAGQPVTVTLRVVDQNGNTDASVSGPVNVTSTDPTIAPFTTTVTNGTGSFTITFKTAGQQSVTATFSAPGVNPGSANTTVRAAAANSFTIVPQTNPITAGGSTTFTATATDAFGNPTAFTGTAQATSPTDPGASFSPNPVVFTNNAGGVGQATFQGTFRKAGTETVTLTSTVTNGGTTTTVTGNGTVTVNPGPVDHLVLTTTGSNFATGATAPFTLTAVDVYGNVATSDNGTVSVSSNLSATVSPQTPTMTNGVANFNVTFNSSGTYTITASVNGQTATRSVQVDPLPPPPPPPTPTTGLPGKFAVGSGPGGSPVVIAYNPDGSPYAQIVPFPPGFAGQVDPASEGFTGGIRTAVGDVTGDGVPDLVVGTGPTISTFVQVYDGKTNQLVFQFQPFEPAFKGGVFVAVGDVTNDGKAEIVITPDQGGGPRVEVLRGGDFGKIADFFGINDPNFRGGARAGVGDMNGDGYAEVVVSAGFQGGPRISTYDGRSLAAGFPRTLFGDFFMFEPELRNGAYVTVGDVDGDGFGDIIGGAGPGGGPRVRALSGKDLLTASIGPARARQIVNFLAGDIDARQGIKVAAKNLNGDRNADIVVGDGDGAGTRVTAYYGDQLVSGIVNPVYQLDPYGSLSGVYVG